MAKKQILAPTLLVTSCLYILFPWLSFNNVHLLMFNFEFHRFEFLFMAFEASTHQLIYIIVALFVGLLLGLNLTISRFFCGYFCPSSIASAIALKIKNPFIHFFTILCFAFILAFSTISYSTGQCTPGPGSRRWGRSCGRARRLESKNQPAQVRWPTPPGHGNRHRKADSPCPRPVPPPATLHSVRNGA